jgi:hypothetical protein
MPTYIFQHPQNNTIIEISQSMSEEHIYIDENGLKWNRVFSAPTNSIKGTSLDFRNKKDKEKWDTIYSKRYSANKNKNKNKK